MEKKGVKLDTEKIEKYQGYVQDSFILYILCLNKDKIDSNQ